MWLRGSPPGVWASMAACQALPRSVQLPQSDPVIQVACGGTQRADHPAAVLLVCCPALLRWPVFRRLLLLDAVTPSDARGKLSRLC